MKIAVTTVLKPDKDILRRAAEKAKDLNCICYEREKNLLHMAEKYGEDGFLIYGKKPTFLWSKNGIYKFHLGTAVLRIAELKKGHGDRLCNLLPEGCQSILDCTFGQGGDSIVLSWFLRNQGHVTALEGSRSLYEVGKEGLSVLDGENEEMTGALRRIQLLYKNFHEVLKVLPSKAFDVIYFDPMFKHPVKREENSMEGFRSVALYDPLTEEVLGLAMKAAKKMVIVKERPFSALFRTGVFTEVHCKHGQTTAYGVIEI